MHSVRTVTDNNGVRYELTGLLGRGGQGAVYAVKGGRLAVKLVSGGNQARRERLRYKLTQLRRLPLGNLALAKPLEMLRPPWTGYVMELLTEMAPIKALMTPRKGKAPSIEWYIEGGGLRRRLLLLARLAQILSQLHGKGLVYSDPSPSNILISKPRDENEVWLIDTDNLQYESDSYASVFTPGYCAPELVSRKSGVTTLTDAFSFAIIAFQTLTLAHPFIGDLVNAGEPELEEKAFAGLLPWVDDPEDDSNGAAFGIPRQWVLSPKLKDAFTLAFGPGRTGPSKRPSVSDWMERLYGAADSTIECNGCSGSFYLNQPSCPWCGHERPSFVIAHFHLWDPKVGPEGGILTRPKGDEKVPVRVGHGVVSDGHAFVITKRMAFGRSDGHASEPVVSVSYYDDCLRLRSLDGKVHSLVSPTGGQKADLGDREKIVRLKEQQGSWKLHFGRSGALHRVVSFELHKGKSE